tara:strand:+ start:228 stop:422 length:195 start_codon:yes stop_codon:yes gene_type:complete
MNKPNKTYTLTVVYNEGSEEVEYLQETVCVDDSNEPASILVDFSDYWDEESIKLLKGSYFLAEA